MQSEVAGGRNERAILFCVVLRSVSVLRVTGSLTEQSEEASSAFVERTEADERIEPRQLFCAQDEQPRAWWIERQGKPWRRSRRWTHRTRADHRLGQIRCA